MLKKWHYLVHPLSPLSHPNPPQVKVCKCYQYSILVATSIPPTTKNSILFATQLRLSNSHPYSLFHRPTPGTNCLRCGSLEAEPEKRILVQDWLSEFSEEDRRQTRAGGKRKKKIYFQLETDFSLISRGKSGAQITVDFPIAIRRLAFCALLPLRYWLGTAPGGRRINFQVTWIQSSGAFL